MSKQNSDDLERFFQKATRQPEIEFDERDWESMEKKLEGEMPVAPRSGTVIIKVLVFTSLILLTGIVYLKGPSNDKTDEPFLTTPIESSAPKRSRELPVTTLQEEKQIQNKTEDNRDRKNPRQPQTAWIEHADKNDPDEKVLTSSGPEVNKIDASMPENIESGISSATQAQEEEKEEDRQKETQIEKATTSQPAEIASADSTREDQEVANLRRWSVLFSIAPDFSSTGLNDFTGPGKSIGVALSYRIFHQFNLLGGIGWSNKRYTSNGEEYKPPKGYWGRNTNGVIPEEIFGRCGLIELPLSLQYEIATFKRSSFNINGGISSYIMLDESYRFAFSEPNPGSKEGWAAKESSRYYFSIATFSAGYEKKIHEKISVGIQPYVKVPVKKIGWSQLELYSLGLALNARYWPGSKK